MIALASIPSPTSYKRAFVLGAILIGCGADPAPSPVDQVDPEFARAELPRRNAAAPEQPRDARKQFGKIVGPANRIVGAGGERQQPIVERVAVRHRDQRTLPGNRSGETDKGEGLLPVEKRIDDEQVDGLDLVLGCG